ncbi:MAG: Gfo/Idh/MocA family oxidoreductase [Chloroflexi bacterium]|nr:Gfo/Idh/MocA family oxidoreductase [Chloroflexota bacterium]
MADNVRLGLIGVGNWMRRRMLPTFQTVPGAEFRVVANRSMASSERAAEEFDVPVALDNWKELVKRDDVDAVVIGTPPYLHLEATMTALDAGKHVLCVPHITMENVQDLKDMQAKSEQTGLKFQVYSSPAPRAQIYIRRLVDTGYLGEVRQVFAHGYSGELADPNIPIAGRADQRYYGLINAMAIGITWDAVRRWLPGPDRVLAWQKTFVTQRRDGENGPMVPIETADAATVVGEVSGGPVITYIQSRVTRFGQGHYDIFGTEGTLRFAGTDDLVGARVGDTGLAPMPVPDDIPESPDPEAEFIRWIRGEISQPTYTYDRILQRTEFHEGTYRSAKEGRWVDLPKH